MTAPRLWLGIAFYWLAAAATLVVVAPPLVGARLVFSAGIGIAAGAAMVRAAAGPGVGSRPRPAVALVVVLCAAAEEIVWRGLVHAALAERAGPVAGLTASAFLFALAHRRRLLAYGAIGIVLGGLYLVSGGLVAPWCAHATYNLAIAARRP
jgi:membrane protease YdiL (CAAX protease family)